MIGNNILHYKILEKLGEGGMGVVYLAEDTKLKRKVAIKFLPRHISINETEIQRFEIEAQAAASLNHPNITTIHSIEESDDEVFIVMEYVEGKELKELVETHDSASLQINEIVNYATQIADGLQAAHKKGIIHRDIKSSNIMVTKEGKIKIMDFGLAKIGTGDQITKVGATVGTIAYMSPEQTSGDKVGKQSDIWSFGVVLYEMLTGELPFRGDYDQAIIYSILNEEPKKNEKLDNYPSIRKVLKKSLKKDPAQRYQNINSLIEDLRSTKEKNHKPDISREIKKLAILPFSNIMDDPETNFLGYALADQIIGSMAYSKSVLVRPSSSIRKYQNEVVDIIQAGADLNVDYILAGNYLKQADTIRLNMELIDLDSDKMIWREPIELKYNDVFELQDIVSEKVVKELNVQFSDEERKLMKHDTPGNQVAYQFYLKAIAYPHTIEGNKISIEMLNNCISMDPEFAPAYLETGIRYHQLAQVGKDTSEALENAITNMNKAISLKKDFLPALASLAIIYTDIGKHEEAHSLLIKALEINPNDSWLHFSLAYHYRYIGFLDESEKEIEIAFSIDPNNPRFRSSIVTFMFQEKYEELLESFTLDIDSPYTMNYLGETAYRSGNEKLALDYFSKVLKIKDEIGEFYFAAAFTEFINGNNKKAIEYNLKREEAEPADGEILYEIARLFGLFGAREDCYRTLKKAIDMGFVSYPFIKKDSFLDSFRNDDNIKELISDARKKHEKLRENLVTTY